MIPKNDPLCLTDLTDFLIVKNPNIIIQKRMHVDAKKLLVLKVALHNRHPLLLAARLLATQYLQNIYEILNYTHRPMEQ